MPAEGGGLADMKPHKSRLEMEEGSLGQGGARTHSPAPWPPAVGEHTTKSSAFTMGLPQGLSCNIAGFLIACQPRAGSVERHSVCEWARRAGAADSLRCQRACVLLGVDSTRSPLTFQESNHL